MAGSDGDAGVFWLFDEAGFAADRFDVTRLEHNISLKLNM